MWSIVIPAFNERNRLPAFLETVRRYASDHPDPDCEVLVVDDGSTDKMSSEVVARFSEWRNLRVIRHEKNRGKGAAICTGIRAARGDVILVTDADGAAPIAEEQRLRAAIAAGAEIACGSRRVAGSDVVCSRHFVRNLAGRLYSLATRMLIGTTVVDTQCGFKMLRNEPASRLVDWVGEDGYAFDVELLGLASALQIPIAEVAINWHDRPGGKPRVIRDGLPMLWALVRIRRRLKRAAQQQPAAPYVASGPPNTGSHLHTSRRAARW